MVEPAQPQQPDPGAAAAAAAAAVGENKDNALAAPLAHLADPLCGDEKVGGSFDAVEDFGPRVILLNLCVIC